MWNQWKLFEKKTLIMFYFVAQNDPEIEPVWPILNTPLKVAQIYVQTKTDSKPVEIFLNNDQRPEFKLDIRGPYSPHI